MLTICPGWSQTTHRTPIVMSGDPSEQVNVSHGMCPACQAAMMAEAGLEPELDAEPAAAPVLWLDRVPARTAIGAFVGYGIACLLGSRSPWWFAAMLACLTWELDWGWALGFRDQFRRPVPFRAARR